MPRRENDREGTQTPEFYLRRYVDEYGWDWRTVVKVLNRHLHSSYTIADLKKMYKVAKKS
jgi:hypothetical protein